MDNRLIKELIFVNYYPGSFGDTIASMLNKQDLKLLNDSVVIADDGMFKQSEFYTLSTELQQKHFNKIIKLTQISFPCHRNSKFDFKKFYPTSRVISIIVDTHIDQVISRYQKIPKFDLKFGTLEVDDIENTTIAKIVRQKPELYTQAIIKDYELWQKSNVLDSDIKLNLSTILDIIAMKTWCNDHQVNFNSTHIESIVNRLNDSN